MSNKPYIPPKSRLRLDVTIRHRIGILSLNANFSLTHPWTILFGPSGSGKTTILRAIAGLVRPNHARIVRRFVDLKGREGQWITNDTESGTFTEPHKRRTPLTSQKPSLFPHITAQQQIAYGIRLAFKNLDDEIVTFESLEEKTEEMLTLFRICHVKEKLPAELSGGEAQRVNLARAAAASTGLLLLDEPFNGLDLTLRSDLMHDMQAWAAKRNLCVLSVTHDIAEAFQLNAEVIKLSHGRITAQGPAAQVLAEERTRLLTQLNPTPNP